jgi:hypothetical protein
LKQCSTLLPENRKGRLNRVETAYSLNTLACKRSLDQHDILGKKTRDARSPVSENRCTRRVQDRQAGSRDGEGENLDERSKPRTTNSLKKGHKCHIRNHEGKRAQERREGKVGMQARKTWERYV